MKKVFSVLIVLLMTSIVLTGCYIGDGDEDDKGTRINFFIETENILSIEFKNSHGIDELFNGSSELYEAERMLISVIIYLLNNAEKNTKIADGIYEYTMFSSNFYSKYQNYIVIWFATPQYSLQEKRPSVPQMFNLDAPNINPNATNNIFGLMIPLDNIEDDFQEQAWYILRDAPQAHGSGTIFRINHKYFLNANYYELANFVKML